jgi:hypothetical protein
MWLHHTNTCYFTGRDKSKANCKNNCATSQFIPSLLADSKSPPTPSELSLSPKFPSARVNIVHSHQLTWASIVHSYQLNFLQHLLSCVTIIVVSETCKEEHLKKKRYTGRSAGRARVHTREWKDRKVTLALVSPARAFVEKRGFVHSILLKKVKNISSGRAHCIWPRRAIPDRCRIRILRQNWCEGKHA